MYFEKLFILTIAFVGTSLVDAGNISFRITNGVLARESKGFPYVVSLEKNSNWLCGGALIRDNIVITTGMCTVNLLPESLTVRAGTLVRGDKKGQNVQVQKVAEIIMHQNYQAEGFHDNDVSLLVLKQGFNLNDYVNVIQMVTQDRTYKMAFIMGWGKDEYFVYNSNLMTALVTIITNEQCEKAYGGKEEITDSMACAISFHNQVVCRDSGSPVVIHDPKNPKADMLIGLASHSEIIRTYQVPIQGGPPTLIGMNCDTKKPSVFTRITAVKSWILNKLQEH